MKNKFDTRKPKKLNTESGKNISSRDEKATVTTCSVVFFTLLNVHCVYHELLIYNNSSQMCSLINDHFKKLNTISLFNLWFRYQLIRYIVEPGLYLHVSAAPHGTLKTYYKQFDQKLLAKHPEINDGPNILRLLDEAPKHLLDLYQHFRRTDRPLDSAANTVRGFQSREGSADGGQIFYFDLSELSLLEELQRAEIHLYRKQMRTRRRRRTLRLALSELKGQPNSGRMRRIQRQVLSRDSVGWTVLNVTQIVSSLIDFRATDRFILAMGIEAIKSNGRILGVSLKRFMGSHGEGKPFLVLYLNDTGSRSLMNFPPRYTKESLLRIQDIENMEMVRQDELQKNLDNESKYSANITTNKTLAFIKEREKKEIRSSSSLAAAIAAGAAAASAQTDINIIYDPYYSEQNVQGLQVRMQNNESQALLHQLRHQQNRNEKRLERSKKQKNRIASKKRQKMNRIRKKEKKLFRSSTKTIPLEETVAEIEAQKLPSWPHTGWLPHVTNHTFEAAQPCHLVHMRVDFADLGWRKALIAPTSIQIGFCQGHCRYPLTSNSIPSNHAILQSMAKMTGMPRADMPEPCCVPIETIPQSLLYYDSHWNVVLKEFPQVTAKMCGCR